MAAGDAKQQYGTSTAITITAGTLASAAARESTAIDNTVDKFTNVLVRVSVTVGVVANPKEVRIYVYGSEDGTIYEDPATGTDAPITLEDPPVTRQARVIPTPTSSKAYEALLNVEQCFSGVVPRKWGLIIENQTGAAFTACSATYSGLFQNVAP